MDETHSPEPGISLVARVALLLGDGSVDARTIERAANVLAVMHEPDADMLQNGDGDVWRRMIDVALAQRWSVPGALAAQEDRGFSGADEEGDMSLSESSVRLDRSSWIQLREKDERSPTAKEPIK